MADLPRCVASLRRMGLPEAAAQALAALATTAGSAPLPHFVAVYGDLRSLTGVRGDDPRRLARQPLSITEWLVFHGLVFVIPASERGQPPLIVLPDEWLADFRPEPATASIGPASQPVQWPELSLALAVYLAALRATSPRLLKDARLPAATLHPLASLLGRPAHASAAEGLRLTRFVEFLAWRLGLTLPHDGRLHPSPLAVAWLDQPLAARRADLWRAWLDEADLPSGWRRYRLPGARLSDPAAFGHRLLDRLRVLSELRDAEHAPWRTLDDLVPAGASGRLVADLVPWWELEDDPELGRALAAQLMTGPLSWLGALEWDSVATPRWRLTALGAWYLGRHDTLPPEPPPPALPLTLVTGESAGTGSEVLSVPLGPALLPLADWTEVNPGSLDAPWPPRLALTRASIARGLRRRGDLDALLRLLTTAARPAPSAALETTLRAWAAPRQAFGLRPTMVLRAPSESHLDTLLRSRAARRSVTRRLSATDVEVDPAGLPRVRSALGRLGHALDTAGVEAVEAEDRAEAPQLPLSASDLAWLLTALEGYGEMARRLGLPPPPAALVDRLAAHLDPLSQAGARRAAEHATARLDRTLADREPALAPVPTETLLSVLETALRDHADIHLRYWTPSRPMPLARTVSPRRIEWHGDTPYLIAYCHLRRDERTFRLDRILAVDPTQS